MKLRRSSVTTLSLTLAVAGCTGVNQQDRDPVAARGGEAGITPHSQAQAECVVDSPLAPARLWMLTDEQYVNVVREAFGVSLTGSETEVTTAKSQSGIYSNKSEAFKVDLSAAKGYSGQRRWLQGVR